MLSVVRVSLVYLLLRQVQQMLTHSPAKTGPRTSKPVGLENSVSQADLVVRSRPRWTAMVDLNAFRNVVADAERVRIWNVPWPLHEMDAQVAEHGRVVEPHTRRDRTVQSASTEVRSVGNTWRAPGYQPHREHRDRLPDRVAAHRGLRGHAGPHEDPACHSATRSPATTW
jgi:hypothetical protein